MATVDRRTFVKVVTGAMAAPALGALPTAANDVGPARKHSNARPPNVVLMICDDLGAGDLGCCGSAIKTPTLDRMAQEGIRFTRFNTAHAICSASRAALLTGRYANRSRVKGAYFPSDRDGLALDETMLANMLKARGYKSMCIGKWHLGHTPPYLPTSRGFDGYYGVPWSDDMKPLPMYRDSTVVEENTDRDLLTPRYTDEAVKFIDSAAKNPFFLYVAYSYPHDPARSSPKFRGRSGLGRYGDSVQEIDWSAGEILAALKRNNLESDTIVMFTSDHGPWYQGSTGHLRGRKGTTFEGGTRVPFLVRWTGTIPAGKTTDQWASNLDVVPTMASLCGMPLPKKPLDGIDISQIMTQQKTKVDRPTMLYFATASRQTLLECARKGSWKLRVSQRVGEMYINDQSAENKRYWLVKPELFNLDLDPAESYDVAHENPEIVKQIQQEIEAAIPGFPQEVVQAYTELKRTAASPYTPSCAVPRLPVMVPEDWMWFGKDD